MSAGAAQSYRYLRPSALLGDGTGGDLCLETSGGRTASGLAEHPRFFAGFLTEPEQAARGLLAVAAVARARYYVPMTSQRLQDILDPVVTGNGDRLRFESFSGCCGVYARLDVLDGGLDGDMRRPRHHQRRRQPAAARGAGPGRRRRAAAPVGRPGRRSPSRRWTTRVVEKKVPLPTRWLRGFAEVQACSPRRWTCAPRSRPSRPRRFLRALPGGSNRAVLWAVPGRAGRCA